MELEPYWDLFSADYATAYRNSNGDILLPVADVVRAVQRNGNATFTAQAVLNRTGYPIVRCCGVPYVNFGKAVSVGLLEQAVHNYLWSFPSGL